MSHNYTAHRVSSAGSTPTYIYRGVRITNAAGTSWGGWIFQMWQTQSIVARPTLRAAKSAIDFYTDKKLKEIN